jgi:hypothetical protein
MRAWQKENPMTDLIAPTPVTALDHIRMLVADLNAAKVLVAAKKVQIALVKLELRNALRGSKPTRSPRKARVALSGATPKRRGLPKPPVPAEG